MEERSVPQVLGFINFMSDFFIVKSPVLNLLDTK